MDLSTVINEELLKRFHHFVDNPKDTREEWMPFLSKIWEQLFNHKFLFHPLFESEVVEEIMLQIFDSLIILVRLHRGKTTRNMLDRGCNLLVTGVKGVGK